MELSILLARVWGLYLLIVPLAICLNKKNLELLFRIVKNRDYLFLSGLVSLLIGILNISVHNIWVYDWRVIITIFGWIALIKGILRTFWPELIVKWLHKLKIDKWKSKCLLGLGLIVLIIGLYLTYIGFIF